MLNFYHVEDYKRSGVGPASFLLKILTLIQKVTQNQGVCRELYTSHLCFLKVDKHRDYIV